MPIFPFVFAILLAPLLIGCGSSAKPSPALTAELKSPEANRPAVPAEPKRKLPAQPANEGEAFEVSEFDFDWTIYKSDDLRLIVAKSQDTTRIEFRPKSSSYLYCTPEDAEAIGGILQRTDDFYRKFQPEKNDVSEQMETDHHTVTFRKSQKYGFSVYIKEKAQFSLSSVSLERDEAKATAPWLLKSTKLASFIDSKIPF